MGAAVGSTVRRNLFPLDWFLFSLSEKMKFALKVSLSITLAYLIAFSQGWNHASTAAITIMMIASLGSLGDSLGKGALRVFGTLFGGTIGLTLIAIFPQERMAYLVCMSLLVVLLLYLARAFRGDNTFLFIAALTIMIVFQDANAEDAFIYGIERTYMTIFGIVIYTLVGLFLWPVDMRDQGKEQALSLSEAEGRFFREVVRERRGGERGLEEALFRGERGLKGLIGSFAEMNLSRKQWAAFLYDYQKIDELLLLLARFSRELEIEDIDRYIERYSRLEEENMQMFEALPAAWREGREIGVPEPFALKFDIEKLGMLALHESTTLTAVAKEMQRLHHRLRALTLKLNSLNSPLPTRFEIEEMPKQPLFDWFDVEDLKGSAVSFLVFWTSVLFWILFNPPGGFFLVTMATSLSMTTAFSPIKPSLLIILFSFSFIFAAAMYILVLPQLHYGWELGLFIFGYAFAAYYFIDPKISLFFLLGISTLNLANDMYYNFALFLMVLFLFYLFLFILLLFYYLPFSTKPEHLFEHARRRFFLLSEIMLREGGRVGSASGLRRKYAERHLINSVKKMELWAAQIDTEYFSGIDPERLGSFVKACEEMAYLITMMGRRERDSVGGGLLDRFWREYGRSAMGRLASLYAQGKMPAEIEEERRAVREFAERLRKRLSEFIGGLGDEVLRSSEFGLFMESLNLRKSVALAFMECQKQMEEIPFHQLKESRF